jgi:hypothetical protein
LCSVLHTYLPRFVYLLVTLASLYYPPNRIRFFGSKYPPGAHTGRCSVVFTLLNSYLLHPHTHSKSTRGQLEIDVRPSGGISLLSRLPVLILFAALRHLHTSLVELEFGDTPFSGSLNHFCTWRARICLMEDFLWFLVAPFWRESKERVSDDCF